MELKPRKMSQFYILFTILGVFAIAGMIFPVYSFFTQFELSFSFTDYSCLFVFVPIALVGASFAMFFIGLSGSIKFYKIHKRIRQAKANGKKVNCVITRIKNDASDCNKMMSSRSMILYCRDINNFLVSPEFRSENFYNEPSVKEGDYITVYVDKEDANIYYVDLSSYRKNNNNFIFPKVGYQDYSNKNNIKLSDEGIDNSITNKYFE